MIRSKGKRNFSTTGAARENDNPSSLAIELKRIRITKTPGEIRLETDIKEFIGHGTNSHMSASFDVIVSAGHISSTALIEFKPPSPPMNSISSSSDLWTSSQVVPSRFLVKVSRLYPHQPPIVQCIDPEFAIFPPFIIENGLLQHPSFLEEWSAIKSIRNIIETLREIRCSIQERRRDRYLSQEYLHHAHNSFTNLTHNSQGVLHNSLPGYSAPIDLREYSNSIISDPWQSVTSFVEMDEQAVPGNQTHRSESSLKVDRIDIDDVVAEDDDDDDVDSDNDYFTMMQGS